MARNAAARHPNYHKGLAHHRANGSAWKEAADALFLSCASQASQRTHGGRA
jgi:hypothetical protein